MSASEGVISLGRIHLNVRDLDRATRFYSNVLGLRVAHAAAGLVFLAGAASGHDLVLHAGAADVSVPPLAPGCGSIGFEVEDRRQLAAVCERLTRSGARVAAIDQGISWSVHTTDPDGTRVEVFCATRYPANTRGQWTGTGRALGLEELLAAREQDQLAAPAV
jgi:catechol 2,3-dioxygenase